jgi:large conductance mechanosensitive channel
MLSALAIPERFGGRPAEFRVTGRASGVRHILHPRRSRMSIVKEFKEFAMRGNVVDMAVGIVIGAAFGKIVNSLVNDVIMPPLGATISQVNFNNLAWTIPGTEVALKYGSFINTVVEFFIVALAVFLVVKLMNMVRHKEPVAPPPPPKQEVLLTEIRDILKSRA